MEVPQEIRRIGLLLCLMSTMSFGQVTTPDDQYAIAAGHYVGQNWKQASIEFEKFIRQYPQHGRLTDSQFYLTECYVQLKRYGDAHRQATVVMQSIDPRHPHHAQSLFRQGETAYLLGNFDAARSPLNAFMRAYETHALNAFVLPYLGEIAINDHRDAEALQLFERALKEHPQGQMRDKVRLGMGQVLEIQQDRAEARRFYQLVAEQRKHALADDAMLRIGFTWISDAQYGKAVETFSQLTEQFPDGDQCATAYFWLGRTQAKLENWSECAAALEAYLQLQPKDSEEEPVIECHFRLAQAQLELERLDDARTRLHDIVSRFQGTSWAERSLATLGRISWDGKDVSGLHYVVKMLARDFPRSASLPQMQNLLARALLENGDPKRAESLLQSLVKQTNVDSQMIDANYYYLAMSQLAVKNFDGCLESLSRLSDHVEPELHRSILAAKAAAWLGKGEQQRAIDPLEKLLNGEDSVQVVDVRFQLVTTYAAVGRLDEAWDIFEGLRKTNRNHAHFLHTTQYLAEQLLASEQRNRAKTLFKILGESGNPQDVIEHGLSGLAWVAYELNGSTESMNTFRKLVEKYPDSMFAAEAAMMRAQWLERQQQGQSALPLYRLVLERHPTSKHVPDALFQSGQVLARLALYPQAIKQLNELVERFPKYESRDAALYKLGWIYRDVKQPQDAVRVFEQIHSQFPDSEYWADATYRLAEVAADSQGYEQAIELLDRLIVPATEATVRGHALFLRSRLLLSKNSWSEAAAELQKFVADPEMIDHALLPSAHYWLGEAYYRQRDFVRAAKEFGKLQSMALGRKESWVERIPLRLAQVLAQQGKWQESLEAAQSIRGEARETGSLDPKLSQEVDYLIGRSLGMLGRLSEARDAYIRVVEQPQERRSELAAMAQWMIGETYLLQREYSQALDAYHRVRVLFAFPTWNAASLLQSGKCLEMQGKGPEAAKLYEQLLDEHPKSRFHDEGQRRLRVVGQRTEITRGRLDSARK